MNNKLSQVAGSLMATFAFLLALNPPARAALTYNVFERNGDLFVKTSGSLNLPSRWPVFGGVGTPSGCFEPPNSRICSGGQSVMFSEDAAPAYELTGPASFEGTFMPFPASVSGIYNFIFGKTWGGQLEHPPIFAIAESYVSGSPIISNSIRTGVSLASVGLTTPGVIASWALVDTGDTIEVCVGSPISLCPGIESFPDPDPDPDLGTTPENPLLPELIVVGDNGDLDFVFTFPVSPNLTVFIDPPVAIGYDYSVIGGRFPGVPLFNSVTAPILASDNLFDLYFSTDSCGSYTQFVAQLVGGVQYSFADPQACFGIRDIAVEANLDPFDTTAFVTGVSFDSAGIVTVTQSPVSQNQHDVPAPFSVLGGGAAFTWSRRLRRRLLADRLRQE